MVRHDSSATMLVAFVAPPVVAIFGNVRSDLAARGSSPRDPLIGHARATGKSAQVMVMAHDQPALRAGDPRAWQLNRAAPMLLLMASIARIT